MVPFPQGIWKDIPFFKLYPIISLKDIQIIPALFNLGIEWVQIREKEEDLNKFVSELENFVEIAKKFSKKIIINDNVEVAKKIKAQGVHLGQEDMPPEKAREILGKNVTIGLSCYKLEEIQKGLENPFVDYIAIGPIFKTPLKDKEPLGIEILKNFIGQGKRIVAIGGISGENILDVLKTGVEKVAFIRFLKEILKNTGIATF